MSRYLLGIELDEKTYAQLLIIARDAEVSPEIMGAQMITATVILNLPANAGETPEAMREELRKELERRGFPDG